MKPTMLQMTPAMVLALDRQAGKKGISRSALVREIVEKYLKDDEESAISARIVEGYRRIPPATPDTWGDLSAVTEAATADLLNRLDEEERREGLSW
ncbi:MAG: ribbon-helix-helix protein, CopG family [Actinomycetota bacterium]